MIIRKIVLLLALPVFASGLCIDLGNDGDGNCFEVWLQGNRVVMQRDSEDKYPNEGILEKPTDAKPVVSSGKP